MRMFIVPLVASIIAACTFSKLASVAAASCSSQPTNVTAVVVQANTTSDSEQVYVFKGTQYILIEIVSHTDSLVYGPKTIVDDWVSLRHVGFTTIDSILPHPTNINRTYVFSRQHYVLIEFPSYPGAGDDVLVYGPEETVFDWPITQESPAGTYDVTLLSPASPTNGFYGAYFFRGTEYTSFVFAPNADDQGITYSEAHTGADIDTDWTSLDQAGFASIDMVIPIPVSPANNSWVISGPQYGAIQFAPDGDNLNDVLTETARSVAANWPSLTEAGFY